MRTALFLLLMLALAAVPGSLVPQRSSDPNGVTQYFVDHPDLAPILDTIQMFDVYSSVWFSAVYLLLFISLIGCIVPRTLHHYRAMRSQPPRTPARLGRLASYTSRGAPSSMALDNAAQTARSILRKNGYRVVLFPQGDGNTASVSAERGYARETGNLVFHAALVGVLVTVGVGGGFGYNGQRVVVEKGQAFVNALLSYDSFNPGRFFDPAALSPFSLQLDSFTATYDLSLDAFGQPLDYVAEVTVREQNSDTERQAAIRVNEPLHAGGSEIYLLGNGFAPTITVRNPAGEVVFTDSIPFLPQDSNLTSLGVVKVPDGLADQVGMIGFFYPTQEVAANGAYYSTFPEPEYPVLTLNVYRGDLGINEGTPRSVYTLDTDAMTQLTGGDTGVKSIELKPGETAQLPDGLGSVTLDDVPRFASFDIHRDPTQGWVLLFSLAAVAGLLTSLFVPRRRLWMKATRTADGAITLEYAGLARGDDPRLDEAVQVFAARHARELDLPDVDQADRDSSAGTDPTRSDQDS